MNSYTQKLLARAKESLCVGRLEEAAATLEKAVEMAPHDPQVAAPQFELARALFSAGQLERALAMATSLAQRNPGDARALVLLAAVHTESGRLEDAESSLGTALGIAPDHPDALMSLGVVRARQQRHAEAIEIFQRILTQNPNQPAVLGNLAHAYEAAHQVDEAVATYERALALMSPDRTSANVLNNLATLLEGIGRLDEALALYQRAIATAPANAGIYSNYLVALTRSAAPAPEEVFHAHSGFALRFPPSDPTATSHPNDRNPDRPLRIGYVSPDFRSHAVAAFVEPLLANHDYKRFNITCYSSTESEDDVTQRIRSHADAWRDIRPMSDELAAKQVREDRIDILIDLAGHTARNRLGIFASKPAPVQLTYLGYPNTTGLPAVDYCLTDAVADPPGLTDGLVVEKLWRLPRCAFCYRPDCAPEISSLPVDQSDFVTFASMHHLGRLNSRVIALWSQLLLEVPLARLLIARDTLSSATRDRLRRDFAGHGIDASRLLFQTPTPDGSHLLIYHETDVLLDTFPWSGHTTACESLFMGVPVITLAGRTHASRMVASVLSAVGMPELIATSEGDYVRIAKELAADRPRLRGMRNDLRVTMTSSPLMDARGLAAEVEAAYREMFSAWSAARAL